MEGFERITKILPKNPDKFIETLDKFIGFNATVIVTGSMGGRAEYYGKIDRGEHNNRYILIHDSNKGSLSYMFIEHTHEIEIEYYVQKNRNEILIKTHLELLKEYISILCNNDNINKDLVSGLSDKSLKALSTLL